MTGTTRSDALEETLAVFEDTAEPLTTPEVAERLGEQRRTVYARLERLVRHGDLETKKVGASARVWWPVREPARAPTSGAESRGNQWGTSIDRSDPRGEAPTETDDRNPTTRSAEHRAGERRTGPDGNSEPVRGGNPWAVRGGNSEAVRGGNPWAVRGGKSETDRGVGSGPDLDVDSEADRNGPSEDSNGSGDTVPEADPAITPWGEEEYRLFEELVAALEEYAIFTLDPEGHVRTWNRGAARIKGYEAGEVLGAHFSSFYPESAREAGRPAELLATAREAGSVEDEGWRIRADGSGFWAHVTITAIRDADGELLGFAKVTRDLTDRHEYEQRLRQQRDYIERVLETVPIGVLTVEPDGTFTAANRQAVELLELDGDPSSEYTVGVRSVYDEDGTFLGPDERPYVAVFEEGESVRNWHSQVELEDGSRRWLSTNVEPMTDESGTVERALVSIDDVTRLTAQAERLERQLEALESELEAVFDRIEEGFVGLDSDGRLTYVNEHASTFLASSRAEALGQHVSSVLEPADDWEMAVTDALETQDPVSFEAFSETDERWIEASVYPSTDGASAYVRDVTRRKAREEALERYVGIIEAVGEPVYELDTAGRFTFVNDAFLEQSGYAEAELLGEHVSIGMDAETIERVEDRILEMVAEESTETTTLEYAVETKEGDRIPVENRLALLTDEAGRITGSAGVLLDVTERRAREQRLARFERAVEAAGHAIYMTAPDGTITYVNPAFEETTGYAASTAIGETPTLLDAGVHDDAYYERLWETIESGERWEEEIVNERRDGERYTAHQIISPVFDDGAIDQFVAIQTDVTERKQRQRELETRVRQLTAIADLGQRALEDPDLDELLDGAVDLVAETLETDFCEILDLDAGGATFRLCHGAGWPSGVVGETTVAADDESPLSAPLASGAPVVVEDIDADDGLEGSGILTRHEARSAIAVPIGSPADPWGVLGTHDRSAREFGEQDVQFVQTVANVLASAIARTENEAALRRQREELATLVALDRIVGEITRTVIGKATREEIEQAVCDALGGADPYGFALIADADPAGDRLEARATDGVENASEGIENASDGVESASEGGDRAETDGADREPGSAMAAYVEERSIPLDPDDEPVWPGATALREGEATVVPDVFDDPSLEPWRDAAREHGFDAVAAIPIVHEGSVFGVLELYADRPEAFTSAERTVLERLGEVVGHAIASAERKRALTSDEVVELTFQVRDVFEALSLSVDPAGSFRLTELVPIEDGEYLAYGSATAAGRETMSEILAQRPSWQALSFREEDGESRFELRVGDHDLLAELGAVGGTLEEVVVEDGDVRLTVQVAPGAAGRLVDVVEATYPGAEMVRRHQTTRSPDHQGGSVPAVDGVDLTDRQAATLRAAFHSGYFEWPRDRSGAEVAESLDVAPPTFHYHLRRAEQKIIEAALTG